MHGGMEHLHLESNDKYPDKVSTSRIVGGGSHTLDNTQLDEENNRLERIIMDAQCFSPNHRWIPLGITNNLMSAIYQECIYKKNLDGLFFPQGSSQAFKFF